MTRRRGIPKKGEAPVWEHRGDARAEAIGRSILTSNTTALPQTGPSARRCPSCGLTAPPSAFKATAPQPGRSGLAWRSCPACAFVGLLVSFSRIGGGVLPVGRAR